MPDWLPGALIGTAAVFVSATTYLTGRARDRRDLLMKIHTELISLDNQRSRALLYRVAKQAQQPWWEHVDDTIRQEVNRVFSLWDIIGLQEERGYVKANDILELWGKPICDAADLGGPYVNYRRQSNRVGWVYFESLSVKAREHLSARR